MTDERRRDDATEAGGGDPVCWAHLLCPDCGAVPDSPEERRCARCGAELPRDGH